MLFCRASGRLKKYQSCVCRSFVGHVGSCCNRFAIPDYNNKRFCCPRRRAENTMKLLPNVLFLSACISFALLCQAGETVTIATVNNSDMIHMQKLSKTFEASHPDIKLNWVVQIGRA